MFLQVMSPFPVRAAYVLRNNRERLRLQYRSTESLHTSMLLVDNV
jgi:hypothetical protein